MSGSADGIDDIFHLQMLRKRRSVIVYDHTWPYRSLAHPAPLTTRIQRTQRNWRRPQLQVSNWIRIKCRIIIVVRPGTNPHDNSLDVLLYSVGHTECVERKSYLEPRKWYLLCKNFMLYYCDLAVFNRTCVPAMWLV